MFLSGQVLKTLGSEKNEKNKYSANEQSGKMTLIIFFVKQVKISNGKFGLFSYLSICIDSKLVCMDSS